MENLKVFLIIQKLGVYLQDQYLEAFYEVVGFIFFFYIMCFLVWSLQFFPPFGNLIRAFKADLDKPFSESHLIKEMIPNKLMRLRFYRLIMWACVFCMFVSYIMSFYYGSTAVAAILVEDIKVNRYTAAFILGSLASVVLFFAYCYMKEANNIASYLIRNRT